MFLTEQEKRMLDGESGEGVREAMKLLVAIGEACDAERMVPVSRVHVSLFLLESDVWYTNKLFAGGAKCKVSPTTNPLYDLEYLEKVGYNDPAGEKALLEKVRQTWKNMDMTLTYSCTPELQQNIPRFGEYVAFAESSTTPYVNAVCGARSNRESSKSALAAAVTGKTPLYGYLLDENRLGDVLVNVEATIANDFDYNLLGYAASQKMGVGVPVFKGLPNSPFPEELVNLGAQLATGGPVGMYHIIGVTPESPDENTAFGGKAPRKIITITDKDLEQTREKLSKGDGKIEFVMLGCPHYTISQVSEVAQQLEGKRIHKGIEFWILTSSQTKALAKEMGLLDIIEKAGAHIIPGTCCDVSCWHKIYGGKVGVTDSVKAAYYTSRMGMGFHLKKRSECINIALKGGV